MKKYIYFFVFICFSFLGARPLSGEVLESSDISSMLVFAQPNALLVFDLDNTLIEPNQQLGSDQWVGYQLESLTKKGLSSKEALQQVLPRWLAILKKTEMRLVDPVSPLLLKKLRQRKIASIGLTKRDPESCEPTVKQLEQLKIEFFPYENGKIGEELPGGTLYKKGVLFTGKGVDKGSCLLSYLGKISFNPSLIIAIDDKLSHLQSLERASELLQIPFIGIRYSVTDERVKNFDPEIAEIQWHHCQNILSDEEAAKLLVRKKN